MELVNESYEDVLSTIYVSLSKSSHFSCNNLEILTSLLACKKDIRNSKLTFHEVEVIRPPLFTRYRFSSVGISTTHLSQKHWSTWVKSHFTIIFLQLRKPSLTWKSFPPGKGL